MAKQFSDLGLSAHLLQAIEDQGYTTPTPIQEAAIPPALKGRDVLGLAQTGTGKTAAFSLPIIEHLARGRSKARMPRSLIIEPTRELAAQVAESIEKYTTHCKLTMALLIGGVSFADQNKKLDRGVDILIATPGRLLDHFERGKLMLNGVQFVVIDEADRMLDMGFIPDIERIAKLIPFTRQTLFFSATMPKEIERLADEFLHNPERIEVAPPASPAATVSQHVCFVGPKDKRQALRKLIAENEVKNAIIFCNRKRDVGVLYRSLVRHELPAGALHGDLDQHIRLKTLDAFRRGEIRLLVASDVAARGLDIPAVSHVFNYDVPSHAEDYIHRIGRTGRAGRTGAAFTLATKSDDKYLAAIQKLIGRDIEPLNLEGLEEHTDSADEDTGREDRSSRGRRRGGRSRGAPREEAPQAAQAPQVSAEPAEAAIEPPREPKEPPREKQSARGKSDDGDRRRGRSKDGEKRRGRGGERDQPVVGMGDHTPAFLLRPVRTSKPKEEGDEATAGAA